MGLKAPKSNDTFFVFRKTNRSSRRPGSSGRPVGLLEDGNGSHTLAVYDDAALLREQTLKVSAVSLEVMDYGSRLKDALSVMH